MVRINLDGDRCTACPLLGSAPHPCYVVLDDHIRFANAEALKLFGATSAAQLVGTAIVDRVAPEYRAFARQRLRGASHEGASQPRTEMTLLRLDGARIQAEIDCAPVDFDGAPAVLVMALDLAERRALEHDKSVAERRYREVFEASPIGIALIDSLTGRIIEANPSYESILDRRFGPEESVTWMDLTHPDDLPADLEHMERLNRNEINRFALTKRLLHGDGGYRWVRLSVARVAPDGGRLQHLAMIEDITDRVVARQTVEASERKLRTLLETMSEGVAVNEAVYDANGVMVDYRVIEVNDAFERMSKIPAAEAIGQLATDIYKMTPEMITAFWRDHRDRREVRRVEFQGPKDGRFFLISTSPFQEDRFVTAFVDITEQRRLAEAYRQAQKLESIGRLAGGVAHDFNNLLTVIFGNIELAKGALPPGSEVQGWLTEADRAAQRSSALTRQLLAFARRMPIEPRRLELNAAVADSLKMLGRLIGEHITLQWHPDPACGTVNVDPGQLDQILANLCVNARDAITGTGTIALATAACRVDHAPADAPEALPGDYARLSVTDSGQGIPAEILPHIFEPFFTTKAQGVGTGLGLSTVFGAVSQHGGFITVESRPGDGATFHVYLPRVDEQVDGHQTDGIGDARTSSAPASRTVLVVEDESAIRDVIATALKTQGYSVLTATRPSEALALVDNFTGPIHLLLTDVIMPERSGVALAAEIVRRRPGLPTLFMTGYEAQEFGDQMPPSDQILRKPFAVAELRSRVRRALDETSA